MFAGIAGMSAEEAWYSTALHLERARLQGKPATDASVDIHKCFDQLVRELLYERLEQAGCPDVLLTTYKSFLEHVLLHNFINGLVGQGHLHRCGIPQGCPLSMPPCHFFSGIGRFLLMMRDVNRDLWLMTSCFLPSATVMR